jgi:hypothetical protein
MNKKEIIQLDFLCYLNTFRELDTNTQDLVANAHFAAIESSNAHFEGLNAHDMTMNARKYDRYLELMRIIFEKK